MSRSFCERANRPPYVVHEEKIGCPLAIAVNAQGVYNRREHHERCCPTMYFIANNCSFDAFGIELT